MLSARRHLYAAETARGVLLTCSKVGLSSTPMEAWGVRGAFRSVPWVPGSPSVTSVSVSGSHVLVLMVDGSIFSAGNGCYGKLGQGDAEDQPQLVLVQALREVAAHAVAAGQDHSLVVARDGRLFGFGRRASLGLGDAVAASAFHTPSEDECAFQSTELKREAF